jgi:hypothetical protein
MEDSMNSRLFLSAIVALTTTLATTAYAEEEPATNKRLTISPPLPNGKTIINNGIARGREALKKCYETALKRNSELEGKLVVQFTIQPDGTATEAKKRGATFEEPALEKCILRVFSGLKFPKPRSGGLTVVTYPLLFSATEVQGVDDEPAKKK